MDSVSVRQKLQSNGWEYFLLMLLLDREWKEKVWGMMLTTVTKWQKETSWVWILKSEIPDIRDRVRVIEKERESEGSGPKVQTLLDLITERVLWNAMPDSWLIFNTYMCDHVFREDRMARWAWCPECAVVRDYMALGRELSVWGWISQDWGRSPLSFLPTFSLALSLVVMMRWQKSRCFSGFFPSHVFLLHRLIDLRGRHRKYSYQRPVSLGRGLKASNIG